MIEENKAKQLAHQALIQNLRDGLENFTISMEYIAKTIRIKYDSFIKEGFMPEQALFLCKDK